MFKHFQSFCLCLLLRLTSSKSSSSSSADNSTSAVNILVLAERTAIEQFELAKWQNGTSSFLPSNSQIVNLGAIRHTVDFINQQSADFNVSLHFSDRLSINKNLPQIVLIGGSNIDPTRALCPIFNHLNVLPVSPESTYCQSSKPNYVTVANGTCRPWDLLTDSQLTFIQNIGRWNRIGIVTTFQGFHKSVHFYETALQWGINAHLVTVAMMTEDDYSMLEIKRLDLRIVLFQVENATLTFQLLKQLHKLGVTGPRYVFILPTRPHLALLKEIQIPRQSVLSKQLQFSFFVGALPSLGRVAPSKELDRFLEEKMSKPVEATDSWPLYRDATFNAVKNSALLDEILPVYVAQFSMSERRIQTILKTANFEDVNSTFTLKIGECYSFEGTFQGITSMWQPWNYVRPRDGANFDETVDQISPTVTGIILSCAAFLAVIDTFVWLNPWLLHLQGRKHKTMLLGGSILVPGCLFLDAAAACFVTPIDAKSNGILCAFDVIFTVTGLSLLQGITFFRLALSGRKTHNAWLLLSHSSQVLFCCRFTRIHTQQHQQQQQQQQQDSNSPNETQDLASLAIVQLNGQQSPNPVPVVVPTLIPGQRPKRQTTYSYLSAQAKLQLAVIGTVWFTVINAVIITFWFSTDLIHLDQDARRNTRIHYNDQDDLSSSQRLTICTSNALGWWLMAVGTIHGSILATGCCYAITLWYQNQIHPISEYNRLSLATFGQTAMLFVAFIACLSTNRPPSAQHAILAFACLGSSSTGVLFLHLTKPNPVNNAIQQIMLRGNSNGQTSGSRSSGGSQSGSSQGSQDVAFNFVRRLQAVEILTPITEEARSQSTPKRQQSRNGSQNDNGSSKTIGCNSEINAAITNVVTGNTPTAVVAAGSTSAPLHQSRANSYSEYCNSNGSNNTVFFEPR